MNTLIKKIKFGTDGWRGIMARDFTFDNLELVARAVADYVNNHKMGQRGMVVGYDNRFLSDRFARAVAEVFNSSGIPVYFIGKAAPTPVTAFAVLHHGAAGAVMLTASHNPAEYNGFKFIPDYAGPALPHITAEIEENINRLQSARCAGTAFPEPAVGNGAGTTDIDPMPAYVGHISRVVDLEAIKGGGLKIIVDPMYGAGVGYLDSILRSAGAAVEAIHNHRDPLFGGGMPEPTGHSLDELRDLVLRDRADLGLALDGDADRFGIIDSDGRYISPNEFLPMLFYHLLTVRQWRGPVSRTVATTHLLDVMASRYGLEVEETAVGFKYIGQCLAEKGCILGGEESGGLSIKGHIPEKDGILAGLLAAEMVARHGKSLGALMEQVRSEFGYLYSQRLDVHTTSRDKERVLELLRDLAPGSLAGQKVAQRITVDGLKLLLEDGSWVLVRASGTEPLFRIYVETHSPEQLADLQQEMRALLGI